MGRMGRLTLDKFGATMPVTAPAIQESPFWYRGVTMMFVQYRTDEEALLRVLPEGLELGDDPTAVVAIGDYHFSTFGPYPEAIFSIPCLLDGEPVSYAHYLFVDQEAPLIAGREVWGYAKKLAHIEFIRQSEEYMAIVERPRGNRILTAVMRTVDNVPAENFVSLPSVALKMIPDAEPNGNRGQAISQLVRTEVEFAPVTATDGLSEVWTGPGSLVFDAQSANDPWHELPVREVLSCTYGTFNFYLPKGKIVKTY
ncbi:MAG: acetoacetate decarboxylase family protein [Rhodospirillales bacterium]|nr:acetoacetate decarboxylase family protein [Rhodospirillales bacterium]